jgi:uncharacterized phage protein (TIGR02218 family)
MPTYLSRPIFDNQIEFQDNAPIQWDYSMPLISNNGANVEIEPLQTYTERVVDVNLRLYSRAEVAEFKTFAESCKGMFSGFWFPILTQTAFRVVAAEDATHFDVEKGAHADNRGNLSELHILIKKEGQADQYAKVTSISDNGDGTERVTITPGTTPNVDADCYCFQLIYARFDSDKIGYQFTNEGQCQASFAVRELPQEYASVETGESPIYLYHFKSTLSEETVHWRFTSYHVDVVSNSETFSNRNISHGAILQTLEFGRGGKVTLDDVFDSTSPWALFIPFSSRSELTLDIYETTLDAPDATESIFSGVVESAQARGKAVSVIARDILSGIPGRYPGRMIEPRCPFKFGDAATCKKDVSGVVKSVTFDSITDNVVVVSGTFTGLGKNYFAYGYLETGTGAEREVKTIIQSTAPSAGQIELILATPLRYAIATDSAEITPGCGGSYSECVAWSNQANFPGIQYVPGNNLSVKAIEIETANGNKK